MTDQVLAIDLGGTKISTALVDSSGRIVAQDYRKTEAGGGPDEVIERMVDALRDVMEEAGASSDRVAAIGVGSPGPLNVHTGLVLSPPNLPGWDRIPLRRRIREALGLRVYLDNDANAAALGEHRFGAGRGTAHMVYVTVSTGIGGGLILDGRLYHGISGGAGEVGHMAILPDGPPCNCGSRGCLEVLSSGTAIAREARRRVAAGEPSLVADLVSDDPAQITAKIVAEAAALGDEIARAVIDRAMGYLGVGMASLVNVFNPELIVIGGGLTNIGEPLFGAVRRGIEERAYPSYAEAVTVLPAELGDEAGVLGAAAVALSQLDRA